MCAERFSRPTETKRLNGRAPCSCTERCAPLLRFLVLGSWHHREGSRAVCQAATVCEEGEDAVKRQRSSTAKIALRLGISQARGEGRREFHLLCEHYPIE